MRQHDGPSGRPRATTACRCDRAPRRRPSQPHAGGGMAPGVAPKRRAGGSAVRRRKFRQLLLPPKRTRPTPRCTDAVPQGRHRDCLTPWQAAARPPLPCVQSISMTTTRHRPRTGALVAIGGNEDKTQDAAVLKAALHEAAPAGTPTVAVVTAASREPRSQWHTYRETFEAHGARACWVDIRDRADADCPRRLEQLAGVDLLLFTGGDQGRLARLLHGSAVHRLLVRRWRDDGLVIAGTSAGASVLGAWMPGGRANEGGDMAPDTSSDAIPRGLALLPGVVIDQHFSKRGRLARLLDLSSRQGGLIGMGIDEDTAAIVHPGVSLTVVGSGSVTLVDCRATHVSGKGKPVVSLRQVSFHRGEAGAVLKARPGAAGFAAFLP
ncbi:MAG: cyanophycinase [Rubrivivax sp.]|nr:MAG: cyanophycinase [Rubrivivax sp.]